MHVLLSPLISQKNHVKKDFQLKDGLFLHNTSANNLEHLESGVDLGFSRKFC